LEPAVLRRWARLYGGRVERVLAEGGPGTLVAPGVYEAELRYLVREEWARSADDILWRRTKLGLRLDAAGRGVVQQWCASHLPGAQPPAQADAPMEKSWS
ncbi:MAG: glycerol-3-phosphate dehydrogenase, partial [Burkholderiaceae bacterium]|nr:glycerol-3-phosphate dehydrogenase [Burkholderiaceae bacterium]